MNRFTSRLPSGSIARRGLVDGPFQVDGAVHFRAFPANAAQLIQRPLLGLDIEEHAPAARSQGTVDEGHMMHRCTVVDVAVYGPGRDRHGVAFRDLGPATAQDGVAVHRRIAQVNFDAFVVLVEGHIAAFAGQPGQVPRMMIAVHQRHDSDAQVGHDEAGLLGRCRVAGQADAIGAADLLHDVAEAAGDTADPWCDGFLAGALGPLETVEHTLDTHLVAMKRAEQGAHIGQDRVHAQVRQVEQRAGGTRQLHCCQRVGRLQAGKGAASGVKGADDMAAVTVAVQPGQDDVRRAHSQGGTALPMAFAGLFHQSSILRMTLTVQRCSS